jgi:SPP1 gp7 family putative phage head morphogenesis protein
MVRAAQDLAGKLRRLAVSLARDAAEVATGTHGFNLRAIHDRLDAMVLRLMDGMIEEVLKFGENAWDTAVQSFLRALPSRWLAALVQGQHHQEATIVARYELEGLPRDELEAAAKRLLFPPPSQEDIYKWLTVAPPGGKSWDERLRAWTEKTRAAMLTQITQGMAAGETPDQIEQRLRPLADGLGYKSERIARTEACRVAERANLAMCDRLGDMVAGQQIVAVMDEWTRPHHAARNGKIYRKGADGVYRDDAGNPLPDLPDEPNCRCMTIPVLREPESVKAQPEVAAAFRLETKKLVPDPASYMDWWERASTKERMAVVGVKRYQVVQKRLLREPEWIDFLAPDGTLLSVSQLHSETPEERAVRRNKVEAMLAQRRMLLRQVASTGWPEPLRRLPVALRSIAAEEPGAVERLKKYMHMKAEAYFQPNTKETQRRRKWEKIIHKAKEVRTELARRLEDHARRMEKLNELRRLISESELPEPRQRELLAELLLLEQRQRQQIIQEVIYLPKKYRASLEIKIDASLTADMRRQLDEAIHFVEGITARWVANDVTLGEVTVAADETDTRGRYIPRERRIEVHPSHGGPRYVHELIHHVETALPTWKRERIREKFAAWTKGAQPQHLGDGYEEDEVYLQRTDGRRWPRCGRYAGKVVKKDDTLEPVEILTESAEALAEDPVAFAEDFPELFDLLIDVLREELP